MAAFFLGRLFRRLFVLASLLGLLVADLTELFTHLDHIVHGRTQARVTHVLLAEQVIIDALLCVSYDEEGSANVAHLHCLLNGAVVVAIVGHRHGSAQYVSLFAELIA